MDEQKSLKLLEYDDNGNPTPHDLIGMDIQEIEYNLVSRFPESSTRNNIFSGYKSYNNDLKKLKLTNWDQWLDGSYSTKKLHPNDIDLVNLVDAEKIEVIGESIKRFLSGFGNPKSTYKVDGYIIPIYESTHPAYEYYIAKYRYWRTWFGQDRNKNPKGILVVTHGKN